MKKKQERRQASVEEVHRRRCIVRLGVGERIKHRLIDNAIG